MGKLPSHQRKILRQFLVDYFTLEDLKNLAFDLGVDHQLFSHDSKSPMVRELIIYLEHLEMVDSLIEEVVKLRPKNPLDKLLYELERSESTIKKVQIILSENFLEDVSEFLEDLAKRIDVLEKYKQAVIITSFVASREGLRLLLTFPEQAIDMLIKLNISSLVEGKYHIVSLVPYDSLDSISKDLWRNLSSKQPGIREEEQLIPTTSWDEQ